MKPAKRKNTNWKKSLATFFMLAGTITLTACGGGGGGGGGSSSTLSTVSTPSAEQDSKGEIVEPNPTVEAPSNTNTSFARVNTEVIQDKCMICHINGSGNPALNTPLVYVSALTSAHEVIN